MNVTRTAENRYHVEVRDPFIHREVSASQFLAIASERTSPMSAVEILRLLDAQVVGCTVTVEYELIESEHTDPLAGLRSS